MDEHRTIEMPDRAHARIRRPRKPRRISWRSVAILWTAATAFGVVTNDVSPARAAKPEVASTSRSTRDEAVRLIPHDKLSEDGRKKVASVMSQVSIFRRLPTQVIACDPKLYLFLIEHPDMVVNMWEVMDVSDMRLEKTGPDSYRANDGVGTEGAVEYLYRSYDTHIMYAEGSYSGPLFINPVHGKCLLVLKTGYVREPDNQYYITCRLDTFIQLQNVGVEFVAKTFQPLVGKTADHNFRETASFLSMISHSAEQEPRALVHLASKLTKVPEEDRGELCDLASEISIAAVDREGATLKTQQPPSAQRRTVMRPSGSGR
ncbi:MAG TPA: hypothetical protein VGN12_30460 [Pirellulales bacterium]